MTTETVPADVREAVANVLGIASKMHSAWMRFETIMREPGNGFTAMEEAADETDIIRDAVPELMRLVSALSATLPAPAPEAIRDEPAVREGQEQCSREDAALYRKLRRKLNRVHPSNQAPDLNLRIELTYGEVARLSAALIAAARRGEGQGDA